MDCSVYVLSSKSWSALSVLHGHSAAVLSLAFVCPDGRLLTGCLDGEIALWDSLHRTERLVLETPGLAVLQLAQDPDASRFAAVRVRVPNREGLLSSYSLLDPSDRSDMNYVTNVLTSVAFHNRGPRIVTGGVNEVLIVDAQSMEVSNILAALNCTVQSVAVSPGEVSIAAGSLSRNLAEADVRDIILLWNDAYESIGTIPHPGRVLSLCFLDDLLLLSASSDGVIRLWDIRD